MRKIVSSLLLYVGFAPLWAQAPPTMEEALQSFHIGTSRDALLAALHNSYPAIRGLAAMKLASDGDRSAVPAIEHALKVETDRPERFNIARALKLLGDPDGDRELATICSDPAQRPDWRLEAADDLAPSVGRDCFSSVVNILESSDNPVLAGYSLEILLKLNWRDRMSQQPEEREMAHGLILALSNSISDVRQKAAKCIVLYRVTAAVPALQDAAKKEVDPTTKGILQEALRRLATM